MSGGFFDKSKLPDSYLNLLCTSLKKKGYVYHFRNVLSQFNKNNGIKELYKKGGMFNIAKNLIKIEQKWVNNIKNDYRETKQTPPYNQLDIDSLVNQINQDTSK